MQALYPPPTPDLTPPPPWRVGLRGVGPAGSRYWVTTGSSCTHDAVHAVQASSSSSGQQAAAAAISSSRSCSPKATPPSPNVPPSPWIFTRRVCWPGSVRRSRWSIDRGRESILPFTAAPQQLTQLVCPGTPPRVGEPGHVLLGRLPGSCSDSSSSRWAQRVAAVVSHVTA